MTSIEVAYGGDDDAAPRPVLLATLEGLLSAMGVEQVSLVNAMLLAEERGIKHARKTAPQSPGSRPRSVWRSRRREARCRSWARSWATATAA